MNVTSAATFRILYFFTLLTIIPATAQAAPVLVVWNGDAEPGPIPYEVHNGSEFDLYAIIIPHNRASDAYTANGWTAQIVSRAEWESGSFTFTDPNGWTPPAPSSIDWDTAFPDPDPSGHNQVVAVWAGAGSAGPILAGEFIDPVFFTDVIPNGEWPGIVLDIYGTAMPTGVSSIPLPPAAALFLAGIGCLLFSARTGRADKRCTRFSRGSAASLVRP